MIEDCGNHEWGEVEHSRFTGTPHRKCKNCKFISLDLEDNND